MDDSSSRGRYQQRNLVKLLQERQRLQLCSAGSSRRILSAVSVKTVHLADIAPRQLLHDNHVVLGFSRYGNLLLSYCNELDVTATQSTYTLHCWLFQHPLPLKHVRQEELFRGETIPADLHLLVCQTPSPTYTIVVGCRRVTDDFCRPCYISILLSFPPSTVTTDISIHFKFDLMAPFPSFIPSLSLRIHNCVVINTGDSIIALHYHPPMTNTSSSILLTKPGLDHTTVNVAVGQYSAHTIPVDVYTEGRNEGEEVERLCCQVSLDVELWLNNQLNSELAACDITYHSLTDYDLQLAEVCGDSGSVILILVALLEAGSLLSDDPGSYSVQLIASWNVYTGTVDCVKVSGLKPDSHQMTGHRRWNPAAPVALKYRQKYSFLRSSNDCVRAFSNHTVFTGRSLRCLHHTYLPLSLTLLPPIHSSPNITP